MKWLFVLFTYSTFLSLSANDMADSNTFYLSPSGEKILDPSTYTSEIRGLLAEEDRFIMNLLQNYDVLFEVGCGSCARAIRVTDLGREFYGIDINPHHIENAKTLFQQHQLQHAATADILSVTQITTTSFPIASTKRPLIFFPFNLMGNLDDFHLVLLNLLNLEKDFCFTTYKITPLAEATRQTYYLRCGCEQLSHSATPIGDPFSSRDGFHSAAFKIGYLLDLLEFLLHSKQKTAKLFVHDIHEIGYLIHVQSIRSL